MLRFVLVLLVLSLGSSASAASAVWIELAERPLARSLPARPGEKAEAAPWNITLTVRRDGTWSRGERDGKLAKGALVELRSAAARAKLRLDPKARPVCMATPTREERLHIAGRGNVTYATPCGRPPDPSAGRLLALLETLTIAELETPREVVGVAPVTVLYESRQQDFDSLEHSSRVVFTDGTFALSGFGHADARGQLSADELARVRAAIRAATFAMSKQRPPPCGARLEWTRTIRVDGHPALEWTGPCGSTPDASVLALDTLVRDVTRR